MTDMFGAGDLAIEVATRPGGLEYYEFEPRLRASPSGGIIPMKWYT